MGTCLCCIVDNNVTNFELHLWSCLFFQGSIVNDNVTNCELHLCSSLLFQGSTTVSRAAQSPRRWATRSPPTPSAPEEGPHRHRRRCRLSLSPLNSTICFCANFPVKTNHYLLPVRVSMLLRDKTFNLDGSLQKFGNTAYVVATTTLSMMCLFHMSKIV